ncbi:hypothetical protein [Microbacterium sp. LBN7]|uniref:hypothetical protein n=1 Tax=Microbacterium sp. LBN7 TaxID=3129773 RepID=UPI00325599F1
MDETTRILQDLLTRAAAAHGVHEQEDLGGIHDEQWPQWYAAHMSAALVERGLRLVADDASREDPGLGDSAREELGEPPQTAQ